jgi:antitoxin (DNA-binding transcriptional repressor) of toxin-antitoxin stability system
MKAINVTELKANLSKYLRMAARGSRIIVKDRDEPVAQIGPLEKDALPWRDRLVREGRLRRGTQNWDKLKVSRLDVSTDVQASLRAGREDSNEVRRH